MVHLQEAPRVSHGDADVAAAASGAGEDKMDQGTESTR